MNYPQVAFSMGTVEVIACAPDRFRLLVCGCYVAKFTRCSSALRYYRREFA